MSDTPKQTELISAIILAAVLIAGSLVFVGIQSGRDRQKAEPTPQVAISAPAIDQPQLKEQIKADILAEVQKAAVSASPVDQQQLKEQIKTEVLAEVQKSEWIDQQVDAGIQRYIQKQQQAQQQARAEQERQANEKAKNVRRVSAEKDHIYGNPQAEITLIEYSDFECPFCQSFHETAKKVADAYEGKVNWVFRHYPLSFHNPAAQKEAEASECIAELGGNDAFWKFAESLYKNSGLNGKGIPAEKILELVDAVGVKRDQFQACWDSGKYTQRVQDYLTEGTNSGISGTPGNILLNNQTDEVRVKSGAVPFETLKTEIDQMLSK